MPLKLRPPRAGKTPNYEIRGSYLGIRVEKSAGTARRPVALAQLKRIEEAIERGEYGSKAASGSEQLTFVSAAVSYMEQGGSARYLKRFKRLIAYFGDTDISAIDQTALDAAAIAIYPGTTGATRNTMVYTPVSAALRHAGLKISFQRPKGAKGRIVTDWISEPDADALIRAADNVGVEFGLLLRFLLYTGLRLNEVLKLRWSDVDIAPDADAGQAWVRRLKGGIASPVRLRVDLVNGLRAHQRAVLGEQPTARDVAALAHRRVFRFRAGGHLKHLLVRAKLGMLGLPCPVRRPIGWHQPPNRLTWLNFHSFRHTWATWLRRAGADVQGLVATGNWRDPRSAARYAHAVARDEWSRVDQLPAVGEIRGK